MQSTALNKSHFSHLIMAKHDGKVNKNWPWGDMNVCSRSHDNASHSFHDIWDHLCLYSRCWDTSVWTNPNATLLRWLNLTKHSMTTSDTWQLKVYDLITRCSCDTSKRCILLVKLKCFSAIYRGKCKNHREIAARGAVICCMYICLDSQRSWSFRLDCWKEMTAEGRGTRGCRRTEGDDEEENDV